MTSPAASQPRQDQGQSIGGQFKKQQHDESMISLGDGDGYLDDLLDRGSFHYPPPLTNAEDAAWFFDHARVPEKTVRRFVSIYNQYRDDVSNAELEKERRIFVQNYEQDIQGRPRRDQDLPAWERQVDAAWGERKQLVRQGLANAVNPHRIPRYIDSSQAMQIVRELKKYEYAMSRLFRLKFEGEADALRSRVIPDEELGIGDPAKPHLHWSPELLYQEFGGERVLHSIGEAAERSDENDERMDRKATNRMLQILAGHIAEGNELTAAQTEAMYGD